MNNSSEFTQSTFSNGTDQIASPIGAIQITKATACTLVTIAALFGNALVICAVMQSPRMRTVTNYLIVNMACADILYTLVAMPTMFIMIFEAFELAMSSHGLAIFFCKILNFAQYALIPASVLTLAAIAFDRFFAIMMPLKRIINKRAFNWIVIFIWLTSAALAAPLLYSIRVIEDEYGLNCIEVWSPAFDQNTARQDYSWAIFVVTFCIPLCAITVLYTIICRHLWLIKTPGETEREKMLEKRRNSRKKAVKMLITVALVFIACWLPLQIANFLINFEAVQISDSFYFACEFSMRASCALNPAIYAVFSENYRQGFKKALSKLCCGKFLTSLPQRGNSSFLQQQTNPTILRSDAAASMKRQSQKAAYQHLEGEEEHKL